VSLINQALKKAQQDRIDGSQSTASAENRAHPYTGTRAGNPANSTSFAIMKYLMGGLLLIAALGAAVAFMLTVINKPEPVAETLPAEFEVNIKPQAPSTPAVSPPAATVAATPASGAPPAPTETVAAPSTITAAVVAPATSTTAVAAPGEPASAADNPNDLIQPPADQPVWIGDDTPQAPQPKPATTEKPDPNPTVIAFLEASRITGVRVAGNESKVVMNNKVFRLNSVVDMKTNLKITEILNNEIQFVDASGLRYRKQF